METFSEWRQSNGQPYLYAQGSSRYELGVAKGYGMAAQILDFQSAIDQGISAALAKKPEAKKKTEELIDAYLTLIPDDDLIEIKGMADGYNRALDAGNLHRIQIQGLTSKESWDKKIKPSPRKLTWQELAVHSFMIELVSRLRSEKINLFEGCTSFVSVNADGSVVQGQNYDTRMNGYGSMAYCLQRCEEEPTEFLLQSGASLAWAVGKSEYGILLNLSTVRTNLDIPICTPRSVLIRQAMRQLIAEAAVKAMSDPQGHTPVPFNFMISDRHTAFGVQARPEQQKISRVRSTLVQSNRYSDLAWRQYMKDPSYSLERQLFAERLLASVRAQNGGSITENDLIRILQTKPVICRPTTVFFLTRQHFGIGNPADQPVGEIPDV
ncbi:MAG: hypothetical protein U0L49_09420 [Eubacterium sp.]|nr:hypothetical protein [Eubacterium sp.]